MASKEQSLNDFWSSFGLPAYDENTVPTGELAPAFPYITYQAIFDNFYGSPVALYASIWDRTSSWQSVTEVYNLISSYLGIGGRVIQIDNGYMWVKRGTPFAQRMNDESDDMVRRVLLNISVDYLTEN